MRPAGHGSEEDSVVCGIAGYAGKQRAVDALLPILSALEYRGYDSAGVAVLDCGRIHIRKGCGYLQDVVNSTKIRELGGRVGIGHVRWATHGKVCTENAHPFVDCSGLVAVVHNGIISNYEELRGRLRDHAFTSETDSEVVAHLVESLARAGLSLPLAFEQAIKLLEGSFAIAAISPLLPDSILVAKQDSPLVVGWADGCVIVASDYTALSTKPVSRWLDLRDGSVEVITVRPHADSVPFVSTESATEERTGYHMLAEIFQQPETFAKALDQDTTAITATAIDLLRARDVVLTACGTSRFACLVGRYLFSELAGRRSEVIVSSEFQHFTGTLTPWDLVLAVSQSGETADVLVGVRAAKKSGAKVVSILNRKMSRLATESDSVFYMNAGLEVGVAATKTFTSSLAVLYLLAYRMANRCPDNLGQLPSIISTCLETAAQVESVSKVLAQTEHIYYIAKGLNFATAGECALKLKEISYIHAESMSAGELKHGTLSLIDKGTPVVGLCPRDETYKEIIDSLTEAKARGAHIIGVSDMCDSVFDEWIRIPETAEPIHYPVPLVVVGQLLAYYVAVARGLSPDRPRNLAKSVTVL